jgi:hypothetical protein
MVKSDNSYEEQEHRKELITEGMNMSKEKYSLSKEEIFYSAPELDVGREHREEGEVLKETPGSPISKTSDQYKRSGYEDAKYTVPKRDLTYSLRDDEDKEEVINVIPSSGSICKSNRIKNQHLLNWMIFYGQFKSE